MAGRFLPRIAAAALLALSALLAKAVEAGPSLATLFSFTDPASGQTPMGAPLLGRSGVLYGVTTTGGKRSQFGTVFEVLPPAPGNTRWSEKVLWSFEGVRPAASAPNSPVIVNATGTIYGFTAQGGAHCSCGTFYMLAR